MTSTFSLKSLLWQQLQMKIALYIVLSLKAFNRSFSFHDCFFLYCASLSLIARPFGSMSLLLFLLSFFHLFWSSFSFVESTSFLLAIDFLFLFVCSHFTLVTSITLSFAIEFRLWSTCFNFTKSSSIAFRLILDFLFRSVWSFLTLFISIIL